VCGLSAVLDRHRSPRVVARKCLKDLSAGLSWPRHSRPRITAKEGRVLLTVGEEGMQGPNSFLHAFRYGPEGQAANVAA
jgi:hypothetical protein